MENVGNDVGNVGNEQPVMEDFAQEDYGGGEQLFEDEGGYDDMGGGFDDMGGGFDMDF